MLGHRTLVVSDYVSILKRRWWIVFIPALILPILALAYSYTIPPQYLSQTLVLVEGQRVAEGIVKPVISADLDSRLSSMKEQILSRSSIQPIIDRYNLYGDKKMSMDDRIDLTRKNIEIKTITSETGSRGLPGFYITFKSSDPRTAQQVCTEITSLFTAENLRSRSDAAEGTVDFLKSQLADAKHKLDEQDAKLAAFQEKYIGRLPGEEQNNSNMLSTLNTQLEATTQALQRMQQDRTFQQTLLTQQISAAEAATAAANVGASSPVAVDNPLQEQLHSLQSQRAALLTHYTADYPDVLAMDRQISDVRRQIARQGAPIVRGSSGAAAVSRVESPAILQLRAQIEAADLGIEQRKREQAQEQAAISSYTSRLMSSPAIEQEYKQLTRDNQTAQQFYDDLLGKINSAQMGTDLEKRQEGEQFRLVDAANLPEAPFSPKRPVFGIAGAAAGLILGLAIILVLEYRNTVMRNERDVWAFLELPVLSTVSFSADVPKDVTEKGRNLLGRLFLRRVRQPTLAVPPDSRDAVTS